MSEEFRFFVSMTFAVLALGLAFLLGSANRHPCQDPNNLIQDGFTIVDPEGRQVEVFDGHGNYWTVK